MLTLESLIFLFVFATEHIFGAEFMLKKKKERIAHLHKKGLVYFGEVDRGWREKKRATVCFVICRMCSVILKEPPGYPPFYVMVLCVHWGSWRK